jgi:copper(I)-binding protein
MGKLKVSWLVAALLLIGAVAQASAQGAPTFASSGLRIYNVWVRPTAPELAEGATPEPPLPGTTTGVYMTIENPTDTDYQLIAINTDAAEMTHVHETTMEGDLARMRMIGALDIPAGETVILAPLGIHAMLMNAIRDIHPGDAVALTLTFADAAGTTFEVPVAAYATDIPLLTEPLIVANAVALAAREGKFNLLLLVDNRSDTSETLTTITTVPASTAQLHWREQRSAFTVSAVELAPQADIGVASSGVFVHAHLSEFAVEPQSAMTVTLEFESGKVLTLAAPIIGAAA